MAMTYFRYPLIFILFFSLSAAAQMPVLKVKTVDVKQENISLQKLIIDVQIRGSIAITQMTMTFYNHSTRVLEGELTFPMPEGVTVSNYALDINGKMRKAVPVEKARATEVFESIENRNLDPGILEKVEGNNFRTRIYPIPAKGSRTITIGYEEELKIDQKKGLKYHLPLEYSQPIGEFSLKATVFESMLKPELIAQPDGSFDLISKGNTYVAEMKKTNYIPLKGLTINLPKRSDMPEVQMQKATNGYYFLVNVFPTAQSRPHVWSNKIGLIWDASLSGLQRDIKKELMLLDLIIKQKQNLTISLGLLNNTFKNGGTFNITAGNWKELRDKLEKVTYDGGTNYSAINQRAVIGDEYIFFTDGLSTFGKSTVFLNKPIHAINSCSKADYSTLKYISLKSGGNFVNLNNTAVDIAFKQLNEEQLKYLGIKNNGEVRETYPSLPVDVADNLSVAGILSQYSTKVILQFGYGNKVVTEQTVLLDPNAQGLSTWDISRIWAQKKIADMDIHYESNKSEISLLSKQFGIVTRNTSLIVLEDVADYVKYGIIPPADLKPQYYVLLKQKTADLLEQKKDLLNEAYVMSKALKTWWNTNFSFKKKEKEYPVADSTTRYEVYPISPVAGDAPRRAQQEVEIMQRSNAEAGKAEETTLAFKMNFATTGYTLAGRVSGVVVDKINSQPTIAVQEFKSDKDYMKALVGSGEKLYQTYLAIRPQYISTPQFYFDVANHFYQLADSTRALTILSNIADLDLGNASLYKVMAYKLKQTRNYRQALFITEKVLEWRPMDAQSYRDYALALADNGSYQMAIDNLYKVLTQAYNNEAAERDRGIEEVIIAEINNLISKYSSLLNTKSIDKRLIQPLPVDIRVVLNWSKKDTDIDLWVTDPNGEKCYYSTPTTSIGGRLSNDFTAGYGPEQFMLRKAVSGKYKIEVDFYGENQVTIDGPTTVTAEIYTHYGTAKQQRKIIVMPLYGKDEDARLVGEFVF
jgi:hypothetical protein